MSIKPIDIQIEDNKKFGLVAFLVDRKDFLEGIEYIRNRLGIKIPYVLPDFPFEEAKYIVKAYKNGLFTINEAKSALDDFCLQKKIHLSKLDKILNMASIQAEGLLKTYKKNRLYFPIMLASILVGNIHWADFSSTYMLELDPQNDPAEIIKILCSDHKKTAIVVTPESTPQEVRETFNHLRKYYFGTQKVKKDDALAQYYEEIIPKNKLPDTFTNIKKTRELYWRNKNGESYLEIALKETKAETVFNEAKRAEKHTRDYSDEEWQKYDNCLKYVESYTKKISRAVERYQKRLCDI